MARVANPWTNVYGLARTLLATATLGTLLFNPPEILFHRLIGAKNPIACHDAIARATVFCVSPGHPETGRWLAVLLLAFVAIGIYPRLTALAHWWVSFSVWNAVTITDGGDQITLVLSTLLLPLALTDSRMWHWSQTTSVRPTRFGVLLARVIGQSSLGLIRWQLFIVYLDACLSKLAIPEWRDGTAMYYWLNDNYMGLPGYMHGLFEPLLSSKWVALITWSVLLLEFCLAISILMKPRIRLYLFPLALAFHMGIALFMGITSFAVAMIAALLLFMVPVGMDLGALLSWYRAARSFRLSDSAVEAS